MIIFSWRDILIHRCSQVNFVFRDFRKAFESVSQKLMLIQLFSFHILCAVLLRLKDYFTERKHCVVEKGINSTCVDPLRESRRVQFEVTFYCSFFYDISEGINSWNSVYADDGVVYRSVCDFNDSAVLQRDIDCIYGGVEDGSWNWTLKTNKQSHMPVKKKEKNVFLYGLNGLAFIVTPEAKHVEVHIAEHLTSQFQINIYTGKTTRMLYF